MISYSAIIRRDGDWDNVLPLEATNPDAASAEMRAFVLDNLADIDEIELVQTIEFMPLLRWIHEKRAEEALAQALAEHEKAVAAYQMLKARYTQGSSQ